ncbi:transcriptional regulator, TetR family [Bacteriovorax sp. BSW11_IV]|uniref:TetR/AcrR family transcriptional regulator n=1 Tax=Bacteriovorax sp. BSW11_IV TaxID=1353529 RepID=UPI00038A444E|nr:TetR family transcriptional regulator [Bacteriovorax sp. BSW11_IV]EQC50122.1 transcriptional regulator, TetR family [Bacteriovorax sp. BSW11_IV]
MNETKRKILDVANALFAKKGFAATSIRDIAAEANVNIAAVNYHFQNKHNLYHELFISCKCDLDSSLEVDLEQFSNTVEACSYMYDLFIVNGEGLLNTFKIFLSDEIDISDDLYSPDEPRKFGPPGMEALIKVMDREFGEKVPEEAKLWAAHSIFNQIVHTVVLLNTKFIQMKCSMRKDLTPEGRKKSVILAVEAIVSFMHQHPEKWL